MKQGKMLHGVQGAIWKETVREALSEEEGIWEEP